MSWKKYFDIVDSPYAKKKGTSLTSTNTDIYGKFSSYLPEYYAGSPQRIQRYKQYDIMDQDSEINISLDIIADFCTQQEETQKTPFAIEYFDKDVSESEVEIIESSLMKWARLNEFNKKMWTIFRSIIKYGDCFFVRDPETFKLLWVEQSKVKSIIVNSARGKEIEDVVIEDIDFAIDPGILTKPSKNNSPVGTQNSVPTPTNVVTGTQFGNTGNAHTSVSISADAILQLSLTEGMDANWPFGNSILESIYKVYKQKAMLEDALLIYRVQRAPERRIFYIDTGDMAPHVANAYIARIKNEVHQKRIPNRNGGMGLNDIDASYDPLSILEDYYLARSTSGRGSEITTLPGGDGISNINDLEYFDDKMKRGLGIPPSYLPSTDEGATYNDGRLGSAFIQEFRFSKYCKRLQMMISSKLDREFKLFMKKQGLNIDSSVFELRMNEPQNFSKYRQIEIDSSQISVFSSIADVPYMSKRFILKRYLGWSEAEILENEQMWAEENKNKTGTETGGATGGGIGLDSVGVRAPNEDFDFEGDDENIFDDDLGGMDDAGGDMGGEVPPPEGEI